jgi:predicted short-subunit dehydrogenase-like oxidoreductase (DUF2520 family)
MEIILVGMGNLGWHLCRRWLQADIKAIHVLNRSKRPLDSHPKLRIHHEIKSLPKKPFASILAVPDQNIEEVGQGLFGHLHSETLVIHTSGATSTHAIKGFNHRGVLWPMLSFKKDQTVNWDQCPILLGFEMIDDKPRLKRLADLLSVQNKFVSEKERMIYHLAAVWSNNFVNLMMTEAEIFLTNESLQFEMLVPLIQQHANKLSIHKPSQLQTGPAARNDLNTLRKHLQLMDKTLADQYVQHSKRIQQLFSGEMDSSDLI